MKNSLLFYLSMMILFAAPASAQVVFGVRAGGAYSSLTQKVNNTYEKGSRMGYSVAGLVEVPLHSIYKRLSLRSELALVNQGGSWYSAPDMNGMALLNKCWYYSLQVPVNIAFTFPFFDTRISLSAGPSFDFSLFGKMRSRETDTDLLFGDTEEKDLKPFDLGVNLGLAVEYNNYFFSVNSNVGTLDRRAVKRDGESSVFQNNVTLSLGYYFRPRK